MGLFTDAAERLDRRVGWDRLPLPLAMLVLIGLRNRLRQKNLYDTGRGPLDRPDVDVHPRHLTARTLDGTFNDLDDPLMGSLGSRFGRNVPLALTVREPDDKLLDPSVGGVHLFLEGLVDQFGLLDLVHLGRPGGRRGHPAP